jgi:hypothetical protein
MESKYYTPKIEEFYVGFEYYVEDEPYTLTDVTLKLMLNSITDDSFVGKCGQGVFRLSTENVRVKYLDREDIESSGFDRTLKTNFGLEYLFYEDKNYKYCLYQKELEVIIFKACKNTSWLFPPQFSEEYKPIFSGTIKNKSEFKKILEQLRITNG